MSAVDHHLPLLVVGPQHFSLSSVLFSVCTTHCSINHEVFQFGWWGKALFSALCRVMGTVLCRCMSKLPRPGDKPPETIRENRSACLPHGVWRWVLLNLLELRPPRAKAIPRIEHEVSLGHNCEAVLIKAISTCLAEDTQKRNSTTPPQILLEGNICLTSLPPRLTDNWETPGYPANLTSWSKTESFTRSDGHPHQGKVGTQSWWPVLGRTLSHLIWVQILARTLTVSSPLWPSVFSKMEMTAPCRALC